jgi:hypothetical protein
LSYHAVTTIVLQPERSPHPSFENAPADLANPIHRPNAAVTLHATREPSICVPALATPAHADESVGARLVDGSWAAVNDHAAERRNTVRYRIDGFNIIVARTGQVRG